MILSWGCRPKRILSVCPRNNAFLLSFCDIIDFPATSSGHLRVEVPYIGILQKVVVESGFSVEQRHIYCILCVIGALHVRDQDLIRILQSVMSHKRELLALSSVCFRNK